MRITSIETITTHSRWDEFDRIDREVLQKQFLHSVPVEASFLEMDQTRIWLQNNVGKQGEQWEEHFYFKEDYDCGYAEYFFKDEPLRAEFENNVPKFYGIWPVGGRFRTNGCDQIIDLENDDRSATS